MNHYKGKKISREEIISVKPYSLVKMTDAVNRLDPRINQEGHEVFYSHRFTGKIFCILKTLSPIHIGSGIFELKDNTVFKGFIRSGGNIIIPGSSLKGIVRSIAEAISNSCVSKVSPEVREKLPAKELRECNDTEKLCVSCRIFGGLGYQGRVFFSEAKMTRGTIKSHILPPLYRPRPSYRGYFENNRYIGRKFYHHGNLARGNEPWEIVDQGAVFKFIVQFENLSLEELSLLFQSMGLFGDLILKIGGGKPVCLGTVSITPLEIEYFDEIKDFFLEFEPKLIKKSGEELKQWLLELKQNYNSLVIPTALKRLQEIWSYPSEYSCPQGIY